MPEKAIKELVAKLFKDEEGKPVILTPSQQELFSLIFLKEKPLNQIIAFTRYGKSFVTSLAVLTRAVVFPEKWAIVAPTEKHAKIIMNYIIHHCFDHEFLWRKLQLEEGETLERLRRERSKKRLTFKINKEGAISEIFILSAHSTKEDPLKGLLGFGSPNVILDESALISDEVYTGVLRMLGDSQEPFLLEIGNPIKKNHFWETFNDPRFNKIIIDYKVGLKEDRITPEQVELMRNKPFFDVLYECKFPQESEIFKREWLIEDKDDLKECEFFAIGTDLAASDKEEADYNAIVVCGLKKNGKISIRFSRRMKGKMNEFLEILKTTYNFYEKINTTEVGVEKVGYQEVFGQELERRFAIAPIYVKRTKDKRSRFLAMSIYFQNGQIQFYEPEKHEELLDELLSFPFGENDDLIDALEMAISLIRDRISYIKEEEPEGEKTIVEKILERIEKESEGGEITI